MVLEQFYLFTEPTGFLEQIRGEKMKLLTRMMSKFYLVILFGFFSLFSGCNNSGSHTDTPTTGELSISVDETFKPFMDSEINTFNGIYNYAHVNVIYKSEDEAFNDLMNDTIKVIIASRTFNKEELKVFKKWEIVPNSTKIAYDAVALICSKNFADSNITVSELGKLLDGSATGTFKSAKVVFDNANSGTIKYLMGKTNVKALSKNCYALNNNKAVIDYISQQENSIGIIGVNWISDKDDSTNMNFLKSVKVMKVAATEYSEYYKPYQAYIKQQKYPLWREVYVLSKEAYSGLGLGFSAFLSSERGQRIILKSGLVPATMPVRLVEFVESDDFP
jgi:phosphate transport system substrate-binding protein